MIKRWLPVSKLPYHFGLRCRAYASQPFRHGIHINYDNQKFFYNDLVAVNTEYYELKKHFTGYAGRTRPLYAKHALQIIECLHEWLTNIPRIKSWYWFLRQKQSDSFAPLHAKMNYENAWNNYKKNIQSHIPTFHKKNRYNWSYNTSCVYYKNKNGLHVGSVKFLSRTHVKLPKQKPVRIQCYTEETLEDVPES